MASFRSYKLEADGDGYSLILYLNDDLVEFSQELGEKTEDSNLHNDVQSVVRQKFPNVKIKMAKVMLGSMLVSSFAISIGGNSKAEASEMNSSIHYTVQPGDTLWKIATANGITVGDLKTANHLTSDIIKVGQTLIIPNLNTSTQAPVPTPPTKATISSYTVVAGDSLFLIAQKFGTTVVALKSANALTSDIINVGQTLTIPSTNVPTQSITPTVPTKEMDSTYTVVSGDSLSVIAKRYGITVDSLKSTNGLTGDIIRVGQILTIPNGNNATEAVPPKVNVPPAYTVVSGDTLSGIAKSFNLSVDTIKNLNNLSGDVIQVGQTLRLSGDAKLTENTITYKTHTVASGDNIWDLSVKYGIPQSELLKANNLTLNSRLSLGQTLKIPVHNISAKETVSERHGELLDWWTEAQYVFPIGQTAKVTDFATGKSFYVKRTIGANHSDTETLTVNDSNIAKSIWGGFSWTTRAVIVEVDGRKLAASMSFMPHDVEYIKDNGITGHFDIHFKNSTRHNTGTIDPYHQKQINIAAGVQ